MRTLLSFHVVSLCVVSCAFGQGAAQGSISGRVVNPSQAPVPEATVTVTNAGTGVSHAGATTLDGFYTSRFLPPDTYTVMAAKTGFEKTMQHETEARA
jgi:hypothetical protein